MSSQKERVLAQLRRGEITLADFDRETAVDGGARITRLAARIQDLKDDGYAISRRMVKLGGTLVAEYRLYELPVADLSSPQQPPAPSTPPVARATTSHNAIDDDWDWKAA
jgi:hypothetical protein